MSNQSFYGRYGCADLSREDTSSGHFTLFADDQAMGHVLAGCIQDSYRHFAKTLGLESTIINKITNRRITFTGYVGNRGYTHFTIKRTVWKPQYNSRMIGGYGNERFRY